MQSPLGQILMDAQVIALETLEEALLRATQEGRRLGEALIAMGAASTTDVLRGLAAQQGVPFLSAEELPSTPPALKHVSPKYLRQCVACPIALEGATVTVATADPTNPLLVDDLQQSLGVTIRLCVAPAPAILEAVERAYGANTALQKIVEGIGPASADRHAEPEEDVNHLRDMAFEAPVVRLVNLLIDGALAADASDIHIEPFKDSLRVRYRIDGLLYDQEAPPRRLQAALTSRVKIMAEMNIAERRLPQDGRIRVTAPGGRRVDIRVSTVPTVHGESIVMRLLDRSSVFLPFDRLGFPPRAAAAFETLIHRPHGILLVTGPTGSGKTTTLYAALDKINRPDLKIITVEDPVEYQLKGVNQIPVRPKIGLSFACGLRHIVRQDPDVIMVGEIRDLETAEIAIQAALTRHLVFSTLHTNDAPGAVTRLHPAAAPHRGAGGRQRPPRDGIRARAAGPDAAAGGFRAAEARQGPARARQRGGAERARAARGGPAGTPRSPDRDDHRGEHRRHGHRALPPRARGPPARAEGREDSGRGSRTASRSDDHTYRSRLPSSGRRSADPSPSPRQTAAAFSPQGRRSILRSSTTLRAGGCSPPTRTSRFARRGSTTARAS